MPEWVKQTLEALKQPARYFLPILLASGFVLFAPLALLKILSVDQWRDENNAYLGLSFVLSVAVVGCEYILIIAKWALKKYRVFLAMRTAQSRLKSLTPKEKKILAGYLHKETRTCHFWCEDGVIAGLYQAKILYPAVQQANVDRFPFNISDWAWDYLKKNPNLLDGVPAEEQPKKPRI